MIIGKAEMLMTDCMEYMATLPDKAFDLAIVDPPYGIGYSLSPRKNKKLSSRVQHIPKDWDKEIPPREYFIEIERVSKNRIVWGSNHFELPPSRGFIFWNKHNPVKNYSDGELAWTSFDVVARCFDYAWGGLSDGIVGRNKIEKCIHPTQKPVALYEWLLTNYAKPGHRILDTHGGSGSSAIACNNLGFEMVWCELDVDYYAAACKRVEQATKQDRLFA